MTYINDDFASKVAEFQLQGQRTGQAVWNATHVLYRPFANAALGTDHDPFYDDNRLDDFTLALYVYVKMQDQEATPIPTPKWGRDF